MLTDKQEIQCPKCREVFSIDAVLGEKIRQDLAKEQKAKEAELQRQKDQLLLKEQKLSEALSSAEAEINKKVFDQVNAQKAGLWRDALAAAEKEKSGEVEMIKEQLARKEAKLQEANQKELELRREKNRLDEERKNFELEKQRQLDEERKKIEEEALAKAAEAERYKIAQLEKKISDANKANDDLKRKLEQGSQQTQGEVLELELEETLKREFLQDEILPVPKGVSGADIIQKVKDRSGREAGLIVWESKKTKNWTEGWIAKLKDDQRNIKADLAVIVSAVLPEEVSGFAVRDGVWICDPKLALALATALRVNLLNVSRERALAVGKNEKMEVLYAYLTGVEFKQRVEAIVEAFTNLQSGLKKERLAFEKIWAEREKQIQKVISNTVGMYGDLSGLVTLPQIKTLELEGGEE